MTANNAKSAVKQPLALRIIRGITVLLCRVSPALATRWADKLFITPNSPKRPASEQPYYESAGKSSYVFEGRRVALYQWGAGEQTVLLVHGWGSRGTRLGHLAEPLNLRGYRVVTVDLPAHGDSDGKTTNLPEIVELLARLHEEFAPVHAMVGHSFGGLATVAALHKHRLPVKRVALIAAPYTMDHVFDQFAKQISLTPKVTALLATRIVERFERTRQVHVYDFSPDRLVGSLVMPFLVVHDKEDPEVAFEQGVGFAQGLPDVEFISTEGLGHRRLLKDEGVVKALIEFIAQ